MKEFSESLDEICGHCGYILGSHHGGSNPWPQGYCPGGEHTMDWGKGPGTCFKSTGRFREPDKCEGIKHT